MPKHIQQTLKGIFAALAVGASYFFSCLALGSSPGVQDIAGLIVTFVAILLLHRLEGLKGTLEDIGDTLLGKQAKIEAYQAAVSSASTSISYAGIESPVESQRERLRRERELILVHGAASVIADRPGQAQDVANGIKVFLDGLEDCTEGQAQAGDMPACKGINCGCTDGQSHSNECIVEAAMIQGWAGDKEARDAFAAIQSKTFASRAATESVATQPAASPTPVDDAIEAEIQAKGKTAPRVTPAAIEANIAQEHYFTAGEALKAIDPEEYKLWVDEAPSGKALNLLTFCVLVLKNGFTVTGESAWASPENFDAEIGRNIARQNAVAKIWPLPGFSLKQKLHEAAK